MKKMKKWKKRLVSLVTLCAMLVTVSACGVEANPDSISGGEDVVKLRVWGGVPEEAGPTQMIEQFNQEFADKGIQAEYVRFVNDDTGNLKLETSLLAGNDIDVYFSYSPTALRKRAEGNMALELSELIQRDNINIGEIYGEMAEEYYVDGKPYSIPSTLTQYGIVINKDMFDEAGIDVPAEWTIDEFREIAKQLTHGEGQDKVYGMFWNTQQTMGEAFNCISALTLGGNPFYSSEDTANINDPINVKAVELVNNMMNVDMTAPTHTDSVTQKLTQEGMFLTERCAMTISPWIVRSIKDTEQYPHDFVTSFAPYPVVEEGARNYNYGLLGDHLSINPKSEYIDEAWEFIKWYSQKGMLALTEGGRIPVSSTFTSDQIIEAFLGDSAELFDVPAATEVLITPKSNYAIPSITNKLPEINKIITEEMEGILLQEQTPQQGLDKAQSRAQEQLDQG